MHSLIAVIYNELLIMILLFVFESEEIDDTQPPPVRKMCGKLFLSVKGDSVIHIARDPQRFEHSL